MDRIADLVTQVEHGALENVREDARKLVTEILAWHRDGLVRLTKEIDPAKLAEAARDPLLASLFELHEIAIPEPPALLPLSGLLKKAPKRDEHGVVKCDICAAETSETHAHLVDVGARMLVCVCGPCAAGFDERSPKYARVPDAVKVASDLGSDDAWWRTLGVPSGVAFFVPRGESEAVTVLYPGPAGATEASVPRATWDDVARAHPSLAAVVPHVQALVVDRADGAREHWICGIDRAYELVARVREPWQGLTGGDGVRAARKRFFATLREEAQS